MSRLQRKIEGRGHITLTCAACGTEFTRPHAHVRGETNACSRSCSHKLKPKRNKTLIDCTCRSCGKAFQIRKGRGGTGTYCSVLCRQNSAMPKGEAHPNWKGGISNRKHSTRKVIAHIVAERKHCEECGATKDLQGHHIKSHSAEPALRADPTNIQVLCRICHAGKHLKLAAFILAGGKHS